MKRIFLFAFITLVFVGCSSNDRGELVGAKNGNNWVPEQPFGMAYVPAGSFTMGASDYDVASTMIAPAKTVSVASFYIDDTEITNNEYRQFVHWVRDSLVRTNLAAYADENSLTDDNSIGFYRFKGTDVEGEETEGEVSESTSEDDSEDKFLDWNKEVYWDTKLYTEEDKSEYKSIIDEMFLPIEEQAGVRMLDARKLVYNYYEFDLQGAVKGKGSRKDYITQRELKVYPDTTVWIGDFSYSYNEPMQNDYFWHAAYNDYPVVGVTYDQANAFCAWRTKFKNDFLKSQGKPTVNKFRLPTEAEWEYSARGGLEFATYPWGGPYAEDDRGCFLANFKPMRGDYLADGALYTVQSDAYFPNDYGLYNMAGNVSEWTNTAYDVSSYYFVSTMNPNYEEAGNFRKVIRGGSWKDVAYYLQVSTRDYEYKDSARSYIGFRTVQSFQGTGKREL